MEDQDKPEGGTIEQAADDQVAAGQADGAGDKAEPEGEKQDGE